jgi:hypothetical protein
MPGTLKVTVEVKGAGPLFTGEATQAVEDWSTATARALGQAGVKSLKAFPMDKTGRGDGGFKDHLHASRQGPDSVIRGPMVRGVTWAPWLEGTSRRNESTKFPGYGLFAQTSRELSQRAPAIAQQQLGKYIGRMGGTP